ncbi:ribonuclease H [Senna tora]|uniref:Ribonuclease H n=1 Tax=Senna tora TaxID=362788 RepID=A0A834TG83_9FABA|nr:ribonuclease H [Senna tora]
MKAFFWNCRGAAGKKFELAFKEFKRIHKPDIVCIFEPRCSGLKAANVIRKLGFQNSEIIEASGFAGGIWALWSKDLTVILMKLLLWMSKEEAPPQTCPKRPGQEKLFKRLDRVLCSATWRTMFSDASAKCLTKVNSDHHPILWNNDSSHEARISALPSKLQKWNREIFGDIKNRKNRLMRRLHGIQVSLDKKYNPFLDDLGKSLAKDLEEVLNQEETLWFQKSRSDWIRDGDRNTKYYHTKAITRRRRNKILMLKNQSGQWVEDLTEIRNIIVEFYKELFREEECNGVLEDHKKWGDTLVQTFSMLWVEVVANKYSFNISQRHEIGWKAADSRLWKDIMKIWPEFMQHVSWIIGDGRTISFWEDRRIDGMQNLISICRMEQDRILQRTQLCELIDEAGAWRNINTNQYIPEDVKAKILKCCPLVLFLGRIFLAGTQIQMGSLQLGVLIVSLAPYQKQNSLLEQQKPIMSSVWQLQRIESPLGIPWKVIFPIGCHLLWKWRNMLCKDENFCTPNEPHKIILRQAKLFMQAWVIKESTVPRVRTASVPGWKKPNQEWIKVNTDGAVCITTKIAGCGGICRDENGRWKLGFIANIGIATVNGAELWGIYNGLKTAWEYGWKKIIIECDSKKAVKDAMSRSNSNRIEHPVLCQIRDLLAKDWEVQIKLIDRAANRCADLLAKESLSRPRGFYLINNPSMNLCNLISSEAGEVEGIFDTGD